MGCKIMKDIPCKLCISYAICNMVYNEVYNCNIKDDISPQLSAVAARIDLYDRCKLVIEFVHNGHVATIHKAFTGENLY